MWNTASDAILEVMNTSVKRWVPFATVPVIAVAAAIAIPLTTNAAQDLPEKSPQQLLEFVADSDVSAFSGEFTQTSDLGLPDLSSLGAGSAGDFEGDAIIGALVELATTSHDARVYVDADEGARLQVLDRLGERDIVATDDDGTWVYDSGAKTALHLTADEGPDDTTPPADVPTPSSVAEKLLDSLDDTTAVSVGSTATVAGRSAYQLVLTPRGDDSLVGDVTVSVDGETGLPLGIAVTAADASSPAFSVAYTSLDFATPDADLFAFAPPAGTDVTEKTIPAGDHTPGETAPDGAAPGAGDVTTTGSGWSTIVELPAGDAPASLDGLQAITTPVDGGRVLSSALVNVLFTDDGRVLVGAVSIDALESAAR
jgi:outer membrane lipoprotein-sorting protein